MPRCYHQHNTCCSERITRPSLASQLAAAEPLHVGSVGARGGRPARPLRASVADGAQVPQHLGVGGRGTHKERAGTAHVEGRPVHPGENGAGLGPDS